MCGIAGIISSNKNISSLLNKFNLGIHHRGPDSKGFYVDDKKGVGLTMTRLSIIGINEGEQPKYDFKKNIILVFNGEIYNYKSLAQQYFPGEKIFSDTDIILKLYLKFGKNFINKMNGMFCFAIIDKNRNKLIICRDRFGIKPVYYYSNKNDFLFCSEINPIKKIANNLTLNNSAISDYISMGYIKNPNSIYNEIKKLEPGSYIEICINTKKISKRKWYVLNPKLKKFKDFNEVTDLVEEQIIKSLKLWTTSDVPIALMLSGGIDSSLLASMYYKNLNNNMTTFSNIFKKKEHAKWNEASLIHDFTKKYNHKHYDYFFKEDIFTRKLIKIINHLGEPFGGGLPSWFLLEKISKKFKVVLSGTGGDELFGNYNRQFNFIQSAKNLYNEKSFNKNYFYNNLFLADLSFKKKYTNLNYEFNKNVSKPLFNLFKKNKNKHSISKTISMIDLNYDLPDDYLYLSDKFSMAHSTELRTPYLDHDLVELIYSIPEKFRVNKNIYKPILRSIGSKYLPKSYFCSKKTGFSLPLSFLMRKELKQMVEDLLSPTSLEQNGIIKGNFYGDFVLPMMKGSNKNIQLIWNIFILQLWLKLNIN
ncbi:asparagine synthase (glutamine-hydrolyzing) [Candidatus Pelagibacter sp.]|nr:asparagine synthase (glutamine-hydrolyzing) [Candidatus Pelagibacter sp.]